MKRVRHKKSLTSPAVEPITWHQGWQQIGSPADAETHEHATEAGRRPSNSHGDNQPGFKVEHRVELSTEPPRLKGDGDREPQYLTASLEEPDGDEKAPPLVFIGHNDGSALGATLDEARRFALKILALVDKHDS